MRTIAVTGKNFGDEGKGLAVDYFALHAGKALVVRHNGGAQSGHTVEHKEKERFVFRELSSGSLRHADTLWADTFYPDMYKLDEEAERFRAAFGFLPGIFAAPGTNITVPDDVLINMALESSRGDGRHGSCGMGVNECDLRTHAGYGLTMEAVGRMDANALYRALEHLRRAYVPKRLKALKGLQSAPAAEYLRLLEDANVLKNAACTITENMKYVQMLSEADLKELLFGTETLIFEAGQGLLLDRNNVSYAPHVTASDTGLKNPCAFLRRYGLALNEAVYVSRTYVTRHGAGPLPCECAKNELGGIPEERTNRTNVWQGPLRFARHENAEAFVAQVKKDIRRNCSDNITTSLFLTHLNETGNCVAMDGSPVPTQAFLRLPQIEGTFDRVYLSDTPYAQDVRLQFCR